MVEIGDVFTFNAFHAHLMCIEKSDACPSLIQIPGYQNPPLPWKGDEVLVFCQHNKILCACLSSASPVDNTLHSMFGLSLSMQIFPPKSPSHQKGSQSLATSEWILSV